MVQAFIITLREGIEAFLIVAISITFLKRSGKKHLLPAVYWGIVASLIVSVVAGFIFQRAANQALWEGTLAIAAAILTLTLIVQLWRTARFLKSNIESHLRVSSEKAGAMAFLSVFSFTVLMVTREGMETALLINTLLFQMGAYITALGAIAGVLAAAVVAWFWSAHSHKINLPRFLQVTAVFLCVFVLQLLIYGFHELSEASVLPNSEYWHGVSEPFGPDGFYGHLISYALVIAPLAWLTYSWSRDRKRLPQKSK